MLASLVQTTSTTCSLFQSSSTLNKILSPASTCNLPKTHFLGFQIQSFLLYSKSSHFAKPKSVSINASLIEAPVLWAGRLCIFYALLKIGLAGSQANPLVSDLSESDGGGGAVGIESEDMGFSKWLNSIQGKPVKDAADRRKLVSKWHPTTKGTLRRNYRVPSKSEGRRVLKAIASLLSDDDHFVDASSHKGCQIRRETAHGESVCCNNVRALFDELPTPHLVVEITHFPAGSLIENDYAKAEKLERVLRSGPSV